jgi:hypothetical protein
MAFLLAVALVGTGCASEESTATEPGEASEQAVADQPEQDDAAAVGDEEVGTDSDSGVGDGDGTSSGGQITRQDAERIAVEAVGEGRVTWRGREDDRGAAGDRGHPR